MSTIWNIPLLSGRQPTDAVVEQGNGAQWEPEAWLLVGGAIVSIAVMIFGWRLLRHAAREAAEERSQRG